MENANIEELIYERKINYYETDKMGVVHQSNYIRFLEEARCYWMEKIGIPFSALEEKGVTIPVLGVNVEYKHHVTYDDTILIKVIIKEFSGVRMTVSYDVRDKKTGEKVIEAETKHCFTNKELRPVSLKKYAPEFNSKIEEMMQVVL